jgi:hypothetical protein
LPLAIVTPSGGTFLRCHFTDLETIPKAAAIRAAVCIMATPRFALKRPMTNLAARPRAEGEQSGCNRLQCAARAKNTVSHTPFLRV